MFEQTIHFSEYLWTNFVCICLSELLASFTTPLSKLFFIRYTLPLDSQYKLNVTYRDAGPRRYVS